MRELRPTDYVKLTGRRLRDMKKVRAATKRVKKKYCIYCDDPDGIAGPIPEIQLSLKSPRAVAVVSLCAKCRADLEISIGDLVADGKAVKLPVFDEVANG